MKSFILASLISIFWASSRGQLYAQESPTQNSHTNEHQYHVKIRVSSSESIKDVLLENGRWAESGSHSFRFWGGRSMHVDLKDRLTFTIRNRLTGKLYASAIALAENELSPEARTVEAVFSIPYNVEEFVVIASEQDWIGESYLPFQVVVRANDYANEYVRYEINEYLSPALIEWFRVEIDKLEE